MNQLVKVVSGGQTGADRAALDVAASLGIDTGGWCPAGRRAEDGAIPDVYPLVETPSSAYEQRTEWNVRDSDATLIVTRGPIQGGSLLTMELALEMNRPVICVDPFNVGALESVLDWLGLIQPATLNVAGPRESDAGHVYGATAQFLSELLRKWLLITHDSDLGDELVFPQP